MRQLPQGETTPNKVAPLYACLTAKDGYSVSLALASAMDAGCFRHGRQGDRSLPVSATPSRDPLLGCECERGGEAFR